MVPKLKKKKKRENNHFMEKKAHLEFHQVCS